MQKIESTKQFRKRTALFIDEGMRRGFSFYRTDKKFHIRAERNKVGFTFLALPGVLMLDNYKKLTHKESKKLNMASEGLPVPKTYAVIPHDKLDEFDFTTAGITYPCVVKPVHGSLSVNVFVDVSTIANLKIRAEEIAKTAKDILVEQYVPGNDYRLLVIGGMFVGCVERRPANVTGDGVQTVRQLIDARNQESCRSGAKDKTFTNHYLVFDSVSEKILFEKGYSLNSVLPKGEMLFLQHKISASLGSDYIDVTEQVAQSIVSICEKFSKSNNFLVTGFDIITPDITAPLEDVHGVFNEFNLKPYIDLNENCNIGTPRPASKVLWDVLEASPETFFSREFIEI